MFAARSQVFGSGLVEAEEKCHGRDAGEGRWAVAAAAKAVVAAGWFAAVELITGLRIWSKFANIPPSS